MRLQKANNWIIRYVIFIITQFIFNGFSVKYILSEMSLTIAFIGVVLYSCYELVRKLVKRPVQIYESLILGVLINIFFYSMVKSRMESLSILLNPINKFLLKILKLQGEEQMGLFLLFPLWGFILGLIIIGFIKLLVYTLRYLKKDNNVRILTTLLLITLCSTAVFAADSQSRFMHNDQDLVVIGQITQENLNDILISVNHIIISEKDLNVYHPRIFNERPKEVRVKNNFKYLGFRTPQYQDTVGPKLNDYILISLNKQPDGFYMRQWGAYKVSSTDYKTLKIQMAKDASEGIKADLAAIEYFINSDGKYSDFSFDNNKVYLKKSPNEVIQIYPKEPVKSNVEQTVGNKVLGVLNSKTAYLIGGVIVIISISVIAKLRGDKNS